MFYLPLWFRNTWAWGYDNYEPTMFAINDNAIEYSTQNIGQF